MKIEEWLPCLSFIIILQNTYIMFILFDIVGMLKKLFIKAGIK